MLRNQVDYTRVQAFYHTWNTTPVFHWSIGKSDAPSEKRSHADYLDSTISEFHNTDGIPLTIKWECEVKAKDKAIFKILNKEPMIDAAWKSEKTILAKKQDDKLVDKSSYDVSGGEAIQITEKAETKKVNKKPYNQIFYLEFGYSEPYLLDYQTF